MNLKQKLSKKLKKTGGFTLIEMLIVVAIIAILVAVSIPMVNASLNKAKIATDDANERAAKGAAVAEYLLDEDNLGNDVVYCYDAKNGKAKDITKGPSVPTAYGQETETNGAGDTVTKRSGHIHVTVNADGGTSIEWKTGHP